MTKRIKIGKTAVDALEPGEKLYFVWDKAIPGFGVRVNPRTNKSPNGKKVYIFQYRNRGGATRRYKIGTHGALTADEARKLALQYSAGVERGEDPQDEKLKRRREMTLAQLCDEYITKAEAGSPEIRGKGGRPKKASTMKTDRIRIETVIKPVLGSRKLSDIGMKDVSDFVETVTKGKRLGGSAKGGPGAAARTKGLLSGILTYAVRQQLIDKNPAHGVAVDKGKKTSKLVMTPENYQAMGKALDESEISPYLRNMILLLAFTGCRRQEIVGLKWDEVNREDRRLDLADSKEGASQRMLSQRALDVLDEIDPVEGSKYVFPAPKGGDGAFTGFQKAIERFTERAGLPREIRSHALRHGFSSVAAELGYSQDIVGVLIGHSSNTTTSRYIHFLDKSLLAVADQTADTIFERMFA